MLMDQLSFTCAIYSVTSPRTFSSLFSVAAITSSMIILPLRHSLHPQSAAVTREVVLSRVCLVVYIFPFRADVK